MKITYLSFCLLALLSNNTYAANLPTNPNVIHGQTDVTYVPDTSVTISSNSYNNVIKWDSFDIAANKNVYFDNKNYLNLVNSKNQSVINGNLFAKGNIYIVNPNGVTIGNQGNIDVANVFAISTALIDDKQITHFKQHGSFNNTALGMGKIKVLGSIKSNNIQLDGSQIIIKDASKFTNTMNNMHGYNNSNNTVTITSSNKRIDIGSQLRFNYSTCFNLDTSDGLVDHFGQTAISNSNEFLELNNSQNNFWLVDDINFGSQDAPIIENFKGSLDGAYNSISLDFNVKKNGDYALFNKLEKANLSNLQIKDSSVYIANNVSNANIALIANNITESILNNIELKDINITSDLKDYANINLAALAINTQGSKFNNINASFTQQGENIIKDKLNFASLIINDHITNKYTGVILGHSYYDKAAILNPQSQAIVFNNKDKAYDYYQQNNTLLTNDYIFDGTSFYQYRFLKPIFIKDYVHDYTGKVHDYSQVMNNAYFDVNNYFNINEGYLQTNAGNYQVNLSSDNGFYFVNSDKTNSYIGHGKFTINKIHLGNIVIGDQSIEIGTLPEFSIKNEHELNFVNNEKFNDLNLKFEVINNSKYDSGIYDIILTGDATNYTYTYTKGLLEVKKTQTSIPATPIVPANPIEKPSIPATPIVPANPIEKPGIPATPIVPANPIEKPSKDKIKLDLDKISLAYNKLNLYKDLLNYKNDELNGKRIQSLVKVVSINNFVEIDNSYNLKNQSVIPYLF